MTDPLVIVLLVGAGGAVDPTTSRTAAAMVRTLGADYRVDVREVGAATPGDADALAVEQRVHATAVIELTWTDENHRQAVLRAHIAKTGRWVERTVGFRTADAPIERGRTLGFAAGSMLPQTAAGEPEETPATAPSGDATPSPRAPGSSTPPSPEAPTGASPEDLGTPPVPSPKPPEPAPAPPRRPDSRTPGPEAAAPGPDHAAPTAHVGHRAAVEFLAVAAQAAGGDGQGIGGQGGVHWFPWDVLSLRIGGGFRAGSVSEAQASTFDTFASAGVVLHPWKATLVRPFGLALRVDYRLEHDSLSRSSQDSLGPTTQARWLSGFDLLADASWRLGADLEILIGFGVEDVLVPTHVALQTLTGTPEQVATLPPARLAVEAGLRWGL
jgi:hypothetical protein